MTQATTNVAQAPKITALDRCDRCSSQAQVRVHLVDSRSDLLFCAHHGRANAKPLDRVGKLLFDRNGHQTAQDYLFDLRLPPEEKIFSDDV